MPTLAEYESQQPVKIEIGKFIIRAYVAPSGMLIVKTHHKTDHEELPLGYLMGTNYLQMKGR